MSDRVTGTKQSAADALMIMQDAKAQKLRIKINEDGDIESIKEPGNPFAKIIYFAKRISESEQTRAYAALTVMNKIKIEFACMSQHYKNSIIYALFDNLKINFKKQMDTGNLNAVEKDWSSFKQNMKTGATMTRRDSNAIQRASQQFSDNIQKKNQRRFSLLDSNADSNSQPKTPRSQTSPNKTVSTLKFSGKELDKHSLTQTNHALAAKITASLPIGLTYEGCPGELIDHTMTMPDNDHKPLYSSLSKAVMKEVVIAKPAKSAMHNGVNDNAVEDDEANLPKLTICEQTCLDANRASFVFKRYGNLPVKCGLGADSANIDTVSALHDVCDHDSSVTQTASKLIHQGVIATLLIPMLLKHFNSAEQHIRYLSSRDSEPKIHESTTKQRDPVIQRSVYTVSECDDGALEFGLTHQEKIHKWILYSN